MRPLFLNKISYLLGIAVYVILILSFFIASFVVKDNKTVTSQAQEKLPVFSPPR